MTKTKLTIPFRLALDAIVQQPEANENAPLVVILHGHTGWKEEAHLSSLANELAKSGMSSLRFDAPGNRQSEGTIADDYRVSNYIEAAEFSLEWCKAELAIDQTRTAIVGHSMGGLVALQVLSHNHDFLAGVGIQPSGVMPIPDSELVDQRAETELDGEIDLSAEYFIDRAKFNSVEAALKIRCPLLLISGSRDEIVPAEEVRAIHEACEGSELGVFDASHEYKYEPQPLLEITSATVDFLKSHLCAEA